MISQDYLNRALALATDTRVFIMADGALSQVAATFIECFPGRKAIVIADCNTWRVAGENVFSLLKDAGVETDSFLISDEKFHAEWKYVEMVEEAVRKSGAIAVSVGSGVINDLCKLSAHHLSQSYLCVPTAASVDGYASFGASISYEGLKQTFDCPAPVAIVADAAVIAEAPAVMTAAGYADLAAKIPCGAEWMLADLWGTEPIIPPAWHVLQDVLDDILSQADAIAAGDKDAVADLFIGLTLSGLAMQIARSSRPASCTDHLFSHYLDMTEHRYNGELQSHGFQVAIGTLTMCAFFDAFLQMDLANLDVEACVAAWPSFESECARARELFRDFVSPELGVNSLRVKYHDANTVRAQLCLVRDKWPELREKYRAQVYTYDKMRALFKTVGAPSDPSEIGVTRRQLRDMVPFTQLMRHRINLLDLAKRGMFYDTLVDAVFGKGGVYEC